LLHGGCTPSKTPVVTLTPLTPLALTDDQKARLGEAQSLLSRDDPQAIKEMAAIEKDAADKPALADPLSELYKDLGFTDVVYRLLKKSVAQAPNATVPLLHLGDIEMRLGYLADATAHLQASVRSAPGALAPHLALAQAYAQQRQFAQAEAELRTAQFLDPKNWQILLTLQQALASQKKWDEALAVNAQAEELVNEPADKALIRLQRAHTLYEQARGLPDEKERLGEARALAEREIDNLPEAQSSAASYLLGVLRQELGDAKGALEAWEMTYRLQPGYENLRSRYGQLLLRQSDPVLQARGRQLLAEDAQAIATREKTSTLLGRTLNEPANLQGYRDLARWFETQKDLSRALLEWERLLERAPDDAEAKREVERLQKKRLQEVVGA
jgi:cytochrome c-type biogenesis protein CcmH/NrfG